MNNLETFVADYECYLYIIVEHVKGKAKPSEGGVGRELRTQRCVPERGAGVSTGWMAVWKVVWLTVDVCSPVLGVHEVTWITVGRALTSVS